MKLNANQKVARKMRQKGWEDFHAGLPIPTYVGGARLRAEYEIGWRSAKDGEEKPYKV